MLEDRPRDILKLDSLTLSSGLFILNICAECCRPIQLLKMPGINSVFCLESIHFKQNIGVFKIRKRVHKINKTACSNEEEGENRDSVIIMDAITVL